MLSELYIENLAVIEKASVRFQPGFGAFTGETGAGKSVLIGGINAVLGGRVSKDIVRFGAEKAVVTALFDELPESVTEKLKTAGFYTDGETELLISREISADGKSASRINGKTASAAVLKEITTGLIDIHGQHDNQSLLSAEKQLQLLDSYANIAAELHLYQECFRKFSETSRLLNNLRRADSLKDEKIAILSAKVSEIKALKLKPGEEATLTAELKTLRNAETISRAMRQSYEALSGERGASSLLSVSRSSLNSVAEYIEEAGGYAERIAAVIIEVDDIKSELRGLIPDNASLQRLPELEDRAADFARLHRKYAFDSMDELISEYETWSAELHELQESGSHIEKLTEERKLLGDKLKSAGQILTEKRKSAAEKLSSEITAALIYLDMPDVRLNFSLSPGKVTLSGMDDLTMLISVNKGEEPKPLTKIASGGELSRIMLSIKSVLAETDSIPTMIFDEIDTGISGKAALKVGNKLHETGAARQVLCVTHLAQIAAKADCQFLISKETVGERTFTDIKALDYDERKAEIARIISGNGKSAAALQSAEELLSGRVLSEQLNLEIAVE
ncbi:DNA repair protein RecN [Clostridia bacterium]|nr:DNA repair protein RecN [Clostridia bacterium]